MAYQICGACIALGYCCQLRAKLVSDDELNNPEFIRDLRAWTYQLDIGPDHWLDYLSDQYRDYAGTVVDDGEPVFLDLEELERPDIKYWFRDFCCTPCSPEVKPRVRREARERVRVLATILRAVFPGHANSWGLRGDNDNEAPGDIAD